MIEEIKKIPLATFLSQLGYEPAYRRGNGLWYRSPLRQENTPSFKVQLDKNTWYDFGIAKGGTIIDLAAELYHSEDIRYLMDCIVKCCPVPSAQTVASSYAPRHYAPSFENIKIVPLEIPHFSLTSKSGVSRHTSPRRIARRLITPSMADRILLWHSRIYPAELSCATDTSKVVSHPKISAFRTILIIATPCQSNVPCSRDSWITSLL